MPYIDVGESKQESGGGKSKEDLLHKIIQIMSVPQEAMVGIADELQSRQEGYFPRSLTSAAKRGVRKRMDWSEIVDNKVAAIGLNLVADPLNIVLPGVGKAASAAKLGTRGLAAARSIPKVREAVDVIGRAVSPGYKLRTELGLGTLDDLRVDRHLKIRALLKETLDKRSKEILSLVPEQAKRERLFRLLEKPIDEGSEAFQIWQKTVATLSSNERKAYELAVSMRNEFEHAKIVAGLVDKAAATGIVGREGVEYAPRYLIDDEKKMVGFLQERKKELLAQAATKPTDKQRDEILWLNHWIESFDKLPPSKIKERLAYANAKVLKEAGFQKARKLGPLHEIGALGKIFDQDVARVMERERVDVAAALAGKEYLDDAVKALDSQGLAKVVENAADAPKGWSPISERFAGFKNVYVPDDIAKEVRTIAEVATDPKHLNEVLEMWRKGTRWWKAWTLFVIPEFHSRQAVSNAWMKYIAGMRPTDPHVWEHERTARILAHKFSVHNNIPDPRHIMMKGHSEETLVKAMMREGIIGGGRAGEVTEYLRAVPTKQFLKGPFKLLSPGTRNPVMEAGRNFASWEDDSSRISMFLWRIGKGDNFRDAGRFVRKHLYDPDLIMTDFEKKYIRDIAMPFWGWTKFNLPLQLELLTKYPQRYWQGAKAVREWENQFGGPDPTDEFLPQWLQNTSKMRTRWNEETGTWEYLVLGSWWPAAELEKLTGVKKAGRAFWDLLTPFPKEVAEWISGVDTYTWKPIEKYPGEQVKLFGKIQMRKRIESAIRFFRPINIAHKTIESASEEFAGTALGDRLKSGLTQLGLGRVYPIKREDQKIYWEHRIDGMIRDMKGIRNTYQRKGDLLNAERVQHEIDQLERTKNEYSGRQ